MSENRSRIYLVSLARGRVVPVAALVKASARSVALRHVATKVFDVEVASQEDLVELLQRGVKVEDAAAENDVPVAQRTEQQTSNLPAAGSTPAGNASEPPPVCAAIAPEEAQKSCHVAPNGGESGQPEPQTESGMDLPRCLDRRLPRFPRAP